MRGAVLLLGIALAGCAGGPELPLYVWNKGIADEDAGKRFRIHGVIKQCNYESCTICEDWGGSFCTDLQHWKSRRQSASFDEKYSYSEVIITGEAGSGWWPSGIEFDCFSWPRDCGMYDYFTNLVPEKLIERRPAESVPNRDPRDAVVPVTREDDAALRALFARSKYRYSLPAPDLIRTYTGRSYLDGSVSDGWLCYALEESTAPIAWPTSYRAVKTRSLADPYRCLAAWKRDGIWQFQRY